ncbi:MAG TPA: helix-turn-helix domain-containing protein [Pyrinomonadaceae bacterium]|jgi:excisionase family DNA binding protein
MALLNTKKAAELKGVTERRIRRLIEDGKLKAEKVGRDWIIEETELEKIETYGKAGRPKRNKSNND